ncbi:MAG: DUF1015 family protein, partial [Nitrospirota bacterium]
MAEIAPLRGYRYNQEVVPDLAAVVTPPYDVISPGAQEMYHRRHPYNMIRLILANEVNQNPSRGLLQYPQKQAQVWGSL